MRLLRGDRFRTIDYPGATHTAAFGINTGGEIVGGYLIGDRLRDQHGFKLSGTTFTAIDVPGAAWTFATGIVGGYGINELVMGGMEPHGFLLNGGQFTAFDAPFAGAVYIYPTGINNRGKIVGRYADANGFMFGFIAAIGP